VLRRSISALPLDADINGLPLVTIGISPEALGRRTKIDWKHEDTELGPSVVSMVQVGRSGPRFVLSSWDHAPYPAITVTGEQQTTDANVDALLASLQITANEVIDRVAPEAIAERSALVDSVAEHSGLSTSASARAIDAIVETVTETLEQGDDVNISGFGKFSVVKRAARQGRTPRRAHQGPRREDAKVHA
jgi:DNA-binding protein HU-beta